MNHNLPSFPNFFCWVGLGVADLFSLISFIFTFMLSSSHPVKTGGRKCIKMELHLFREIWYWILLSQEKEGEKINGGNVYFEYSRHAFTFTPSVKKKEEVSGEDIK